MASGAGGIPCQSCTLCSASVPTRATVHSVDCEPVRCPQSSVRVKIAARDVAKHILGGTLKFAQIKELVAEHGLGLSDLKVVISVLDYVLKGAVKFNVDTADFATELEQLGECSLPAPCLAPWLHALTCRCPVPCVAAGLPRETAASVSRVYAAQKEALRARQEARSLQVRPGRCTAMRLQPCVPLLYAHHDVAAPTPGEPGMERRLHCCVQLTGGTMLAAAVHM